MRTLTVKKNGGGGAFNSGWNQAKIIKAEYDSWNDKKVLDIWFEGFPETLNMRVYEAVNADGEEFAIGQIFRFANAGIIEGLESDDGNVVIKMSDEASELEGKYLNIYLYKDGKYFRVLSSAAPTSFENAVDKFSEAIESISLQNLTIDKDILNIVIQNWSDKKAISIKTIYHEEWDEQNQNYRRYLEPDYEDKYEEFLNEYGDMLDKVYESAKLCNT